MIVEVYEDEWGKITLYRKRESSFGSAWPGRLIGTMHLPLYDQAGNELSPREEEEARERG